MLLLHFKQHLGVQCTTRAVAFVCGWGIRDLSSSYIYIYTSYQFPIPALAGQCFGLTERRTGRETTELLPRDTYGLSSTCAWPTLRRGAMANAKPNRPTLGSVRCRTARIRNPNVLRPETTTSDSSFLPRACGTATVKCRCHAPSGAVDARSSRE